MRTRKVLAALVVGAVTTTTLSVVTPGTAFASTTDEVTAALATVDARNDNLVVEAAASKTDADSAAQTKTVDVPSDPTKGIKFTAASGQSMTIQLPGASKTARGKKRDGVVVYETKADSVNAVVPSKDGVQLWTHIRNKRAPQAYRYCTDGITYTMMPTGGALGMNKANQPVVVIPPPTATEKKTGRPVATSYKAEGNCLVQHVAHKVKGTSYPVVADPRWIERQW